MSDPLPSANGLLDDRFAFLSEASRLLAESLDIGPTLKTIARLCVPSLADISAVVLVPQEGEPQRIAIESTTRERTEEARRSFDGYRLDLSAPTGLANVVRTGAPAFLPVVPPEFIAMASTDETGRKFLAAAQFTSFMCVPMTARGRVLGTISLGMNTSSRRFTQVDLEFVMEVGRRAGVAVDNSQLYAAANAAIALRDQFLTVASHELKTPITALSLNLDSLRRMAKAKPDEVANRLNLRIPMIMQQMRQLTGLVDRLLDGTQLTEGHLPLSPEPVDAATLAEEVADRFQELAQQVDSQISLDLVPGIVGRWDRLRIDQVVSNLIDNALKYGQARFRCPGPAL